ncbi:MAG: DUF6265 family protein [Phycisphaerales bacterium]
MQTRRTLTPIAGASLAALAIALAGCASSQQHTATAQPAHSDHPFAWLAGSWRCDNDAGTWEEHWFEPTPNGSMAGSLRWTRPDGTIALLELFSITPAPPATPAHPDTAPGGQPHPALFLRHFDAALTPWKSEREAPKRFAITHLQRDELIATEFPDALTMIRYRAPAPNPGAPHTPAPTMTAEVLSRPDITAPWTTQAFFAFDRVK